MKSRILPVFFLALLFAMGLSGCGGGKSSVQATTSTTTMGQELMDLDESRNKGIITDDEYKKAKKAILKKYE